MLRKITLGLIAAASLSFAAVAPASAHGFHGGWGHGGWGHGFGFGGLYISTPASATAISSRWFRPAAGCACAPSTSALTTSTDHAPPTMEALIASRDRGFPRAYSSTKVAVSGMPARDVR